MEKRLKQVYVWLAVAVASAGCASPAVYAPPKQPQVAQDCPFGRVLVCRDRYKNVKVRGEDEEQEFCMCQDLGKVR